MIKVELGAVQKKLFMPLLARALETKKLNPILIDTKALEIINSIDYNFEEMEKNIKELNRISWIAKSLKYDEIIKEFIDKHTNPVIINIGCGMDTTYERINNNKVKWFDLDLPEVIELKKQFISESENRKFITASMLETQWYQLAGQRENVMIVSVGVLSYYREEQIKKLFRNITCNLKKPQLLFDAASHHGVKAANKIISHIGLDKDFYMKWALDDINLIEKWDIRYRLLNKYNTYKIEGLKLKFKDRILADISDYLNNQYILHMKITN